MEIRDRVTGANMDRPIPLNAWTRRPRPVRIALQAGGAGSVVWLLLFLVFGDAGLRLKVPIERVTIALVEKGVFHDFIPLRGTVAPRDTIYADAVSGGQIQRIY